VISAKPTCALLISTVLVLVPRLAAACAVCFAGRSDEARVAFVATSGLLTVLPLLMIGSLVWWLFRRARQIRDDDRSESPAID
jgi:hypothetical protein